MDFDCGELWDWWNAGMFPRPAHYICSENTRPKFSILAAILNVFSKHHHSLLLSPPLKILSLIDGLT